MGEREKGRKTVVENVEKEDFYLVFNGGGETVDTIGISKLEWFNLH